MITDWVENGLLGAPTFQKSTQHGSDHRLFSAGQRRIFSDLLRARQRSPHDRIPLDRIAEVVVHIWLDFHEAVDVDQARRALRTWSRGAGRATADRRVATSRAVLTQVMHPQASVKTRRAALAAIQAAERVGRDVAAAQALPPNQRTTDLQLAVEWKQVYSALIAASLPAAALPGQGIERGYGLPEMPFGLDDMLAAWISGLNVKIRLAGEQVSEKDLTAARLRHRVQWEGYLRNQSQWHARSMDPHLFAPPANADEYSRQYVDGFITALGRRLGTRAEAEEQVRALDAVVRRRVPDGV